MFPTILEIAEKAGVSTGTVSRILNGKNKENRPAIARRAERIRQLAAEMGYRPNAAARSMFSGRFNAAAFITCSDIGADWFPRFLLHGIHASLQEIGYRLIVTEVPAASLKDPDYVPHLLQETNVDAMLVYPDPGFSEHVIPFFEQQRQPVVWLNLKQPQRAVYPDDFHGAALAVGHLVAQGHERIAYLARPQNSLRRHFSEADRHDGFIRAMHEQGLSPHRIRAIRDEHLLHSTLDHARALLEEFPDTTAVVCYEQEEALVTYVAAIATGRRVPEDLSIIAFHEGEIRSHTGLTIPTVKVPFANVGREAVRMLGSMLAGNSHGIDSVAIPYAEIRE